MQRTDVQGSTRVCAARFPYPMNTANATAVSPAMKSLVIDDDAPMLDVLSGLLTEAGYEPTTVPDGRAGIEAARRLRPSLIICDVTMPGTDGYDVLRALKHDPNTAVIPFIFLSGNHEHEFVRQGMGLGADDYLTKPFQPQQLFDSMKARIERQRVIMRKLEELRISLAQSVPNEFFTPLNVILGFSILVLNSLRSGEEVNRNDVEDSMESIHNAGEQLLRIASNYVLFTQLSTEQSFSRAAPPPIEHEEWEPSLARAVRKHALQCNRMKDLHYSFANAPLAIVGQHLEKIAIELLDNALKFSRSGEWVSVTGAVAGDSYVLRVSDHGRGMTREQIESLAPLVQIDRARMVQPGVGLGLHISRLLVERYGGVLAMTPNRDKGITVEVTLPLAVAAPAPAS